MSFSIDGFVFDRITMGIAENSAGDILYTLTQLADATIEITSESKEARDKDGTLIKKFYTGKSGTFSANNAILDMNILAAGTGSPKEVAGAGVAAIDMPVIRSVAKGTTSVQVAGIKADTVRVIGVSANGTKVASYTKSAVASTTAFAVADTTVTLPTATDVHEFVIMGTRSVTSGTKVTNRADQFPDTITLTLKCIAVEQCTPDVARSVYVRIPSFQVSPDTSVALQTDTQLQFNGDLQVAYCNESGKVLYEIYFPEDDGEVTA